MKKRILLSLVLLLITAGLVPAATRFVPDEYATIQAAIDDCVDGDTVIVAPGTYTSDGNRDIDFYGKAITVRSTDPNDQNIVAATIIDCDGTEAEHHRGFYFHSGEDANSVLDGFTITNGYASGFWPENRGGGICCYNSNPTITNCIIVSNTAAGQGGGICCYNSNPTITNCTISNNTAGQGGGIYNFYSSPTITNCIITGNTANGDCGGGGINCDRESNPKITNCVINSNTASNSGGAIYFRDGSPIIASCTITNNTAGWRGGGIYGYYDVSPTTPNCRITNCTISYNSAEDSGGGGIHCGGINAIITNCTFMGNSALDGNAMACDSPYPRPSTVRLANCILWDGSNEIWNNDGSTITVTYSNIQGGWPGLGNINVNPRFVDPNNGDYHLKSEGWRWTEELVHDSHWYYDFMTSRCIDAGNPGCLLGDELLSVPSDPNNEWGINIRINMGAYGGTAEASMPPHGWALLADLTNDRIVNFNDLDVFVQYWLDIGECIPSDLNRNQSVDFLDYAIFAENWSYDALPILTDADIILELEYLETINTYPENLNIDPNNYPIVLGRYSENWLVLIEKYFCSDVCPDNGRVVLIYEDITYEDCAEIGGVAIIDPAWGSYIGCAPDVE